ncbi:MAG: hypothetical protein ABJ333_02045 [Algoriphagus sp.]
MNTKKVYYLLILLALIYNILLMMEDNCSAKEVNEKATLNIKTDLIEAK